MRLISKIIMSNNLTKNTQTDDVELLKKIAKYESRALEELYNRYSDIVYSLVLKIIGNTSTAEEIVSEIFTIIWKKSYKIDFTIISPYTWIILLSRNRAVDYVQRQRNKYEMDIYTDEYEDKYIIPYLDKGIDKIDLHTAENIKEKFIKSYDELTDAQKLVINQAFFKGYYLEEITQELHIPVETVRAKVMTALFSLQENLLSGE